MHQTTVRFGPDLWEALEAECGRLGMSAAQFLREAALARLAFTAGRRGDEGYELAFAAPGASQHEEQEHLSAKQGRGSASEQVLAARAVRAQSEPARKRAREVREQAAKLRRLRKEGAL
jgi:hypothetical protein